MPSLKKINGRYYLYFYDPTRRPKRKCVALGTTRKDVAVKKARQYELDQANGLFDPWAKKGAVVRPASLTISEASDAFLESRNKLRPASRRAYALAMRGVLGHIPTGLPVAALDVTHLRPYIEDRRVSDSTRQHRFRHLRVFVRWLLRNDYLKADPLRTFSAPKAQRSTPAHLSLDEYKTLLARLDQKQAWLARVVRFAAFTGLRAGELCSLDVGSVQLWEGAGVVNVRNSARFKTKSGHDHQVPLVGDALSVAQSQTAGREASAPLLPASRGGRLTPSQASKAFKKAIRDAGFDEGLHLHSLRHTCAVWLRSNGADLHTVSKVLGHSSIQPTQIYANITTDALRAEMERGLVGKGQRG